MIVIPMAGKGRRFVEAGYTTPKPLIDINGEPMILHVLKNLAAVSSYLLITNDSLYDDVCDCIDYFRGESPVHIVNIDILEYGESQGAAQTVLWGLHAVGYTRGEPLVIANCDQLVDQLDTTLFLQDMYNSRCDGLIQYVSTHDPSYSFAEAKLVDSALQVTRIAEKEVISDFGTTGIYHWSRIEDFVKYGSRMIECDNRSKGEFYVAPVYNEAIKDGKVFHLRRASDMWNLGTPAGLEKYKEHLNNL